MPPELDKAVLCHLSQNRYNLFIQQAMTASKQWLQLLLHLVSMKYQFVGMVTLNGRNKSIVCQYIYVLTKKLLIFFENLI